MVNGKLLTEDNVRVAEQVKELVYVRDGMDDWLLEKGGNQWQY